MSVDPDLEEELRYRLRQQSLVSEFGLFVLKGRPLKGILDEACRIAAAGLKTEFAKTLEYLPAERMLLVRAGVGWRDGVVGHARIGADLASPAGYALQTGRPTISNHLANESRFRTPSLLAEHGIKRAVNVIIQGSEAPFGVLEVDSPNEGRFSEHDTHFLQLVANALGVAIERNLMEQNLRDTVEQRNLLLKEFSHRVKNNLQVVSSLLAMEARRARDDPVRLRFEAVSNRVQALSRLYDHLYQADRVTEVEFGHYLEDLTSELGRFHGLATGPVRLEVETEPLVLGRDRAIPLAQIANELITNALKHAFPPGREGTIRVSLRCAGGSAILSVADDGQGAPATAADGGLGRQLVAALAAQLEATVDVAQNGGTALTVTLPL